MSGMIAFLISCSLNGYPLVKAPKRDEKHVKTDPHRSNDPHILLKDIGILLPFGNNLVFHGEINDLEDILGHLRAICSTFTSPANCSTWSDPRNRAPPADMDRARSP
jgi:hypothetical protein